MYVVQISTKTQIFRYAGVRHFSNIFGPEAEFLTRSLHCFFACAPRETSAVAAEVPLVSLPWPKSFDKPSLWTRDWDKYEESIVKRWSDTGLNHYAARYGYPITRPDPSLAQQFKHLCRYFPPDEALIYFIGREIWQWNDTLKGAPNFEDYINGQCERYRTFGFHFSLGLLDELQHKFFGRSIPHDDAAFWRELLWTGPTDGDPMKHTRTPIKRLAAPLLEFRDHEIRKNLLDLWRLGYNLHVTHGTPHAFANEGGLYDAIRSMDSSAVLEVLDPNEQIPNKETPFWGRVPPESRERLQVVYNLRLEASKSAMGTTFADDTQLEPLILFGLAPQHLGRSFPRVDVEKIWDFVLQSSNWTNVFHRGDVNHALNVLQDAGLVEESDEKYALTIMGWKLLSLCDQDGLGAHRANNLNKTGRYQLPPMVLDAENALAQPLSLVLPSPNKKHVGLGVETALPVP